MYLGLCFVRDTLPRWFYGDVVADFVDEKFAKLVQRKLVHNRLDLVVVLVLVHEVVAVRKRAPEIFVFALVVNVLGDF